MSVPLKGGKDPLAGRGSHTRNKILRLMFDPSTSHSAGSPPLSGEDKKQAALMDSLF